MSFYSTNIAFAHTGDGAQGIHDSLSLGMMGGFGWFFMVLFWALVALGVIALFKYVMEGRKKNKDFGGKTYVCIKCGYEYKEKKWAIECQKWCAEKHSCNLDIIKHGSPPLS